MTTEAAGEGQASSSRRRPLRSPSPQASEATGETAGEALRRLRVRTGGAVYVEFLIAFMPLFVMFMSTVQLAFVEIANVVTKHAAVTGCRAAIVVLPDDPADYGNAQTYTVVGKRKADIEAAVKGPLRAVSVVPIVKVTFPTSPAGDDDRRTFAHDALVRVQVKFDYLCQIPIGKNFVCGLLGVKVLKAEAALPMQGANYVY
jgi:hypothetical protein